MTQNEIFKYYINELDINAQEQFFKRKITYSYHSDNNYRKLYMKTIQTSIIHGGRGVLLNILRIIEY